MEALLLGIYSFVFAVVLPGTDLEGAVVFLASPASDYLSGHIMPVDGGWCGR